MTPQDTHAVRVEYLHHQVAHSLRDKILSGRYRHGQALPSTRELAEQWGVSVFTINQAMRILADEGLVVSQSRSKRVVHCPDPLTSPDVARSPHVVMVGGYAGSGKTEFGRVLARRTGWAILDKDTLTRPATEKTLELLGCSPNDRYSQAYLTHVRPREYEALIQAGIDNAECNNGSVLSAPFISEFQDQTKLSRMQARFAAAGSPVVFVWVRCDLETMHTYIRQRGAARDAYKLDHWDEYAATLDLAFEPVAEHHMIENSSASRPLDEQADELLATLSRALHEQ